MFLNHFIPFLLINNFIHFYNCLINNFYVLLYVIQLSTIYIKYNLRLCILTTIQLFILNIIVHINAIVGIFVVDKNEVMIA